MSIHFFTHRVMREARLLHIATQNVNVPGGSESELRRNENSEANNKQESSAAKQQEAGINGARDNQSLLEGLMGNWQNAIQTADKGAAELRGEQAGNQAQEKTMEAQLKKEAVSRQATVQEAAKAEVAVSVQGETAEQAQARKGRIEAADDIADVSTEMLTLGMAEGGKTEMQAKPTTINAVASSSAGAEAVAKDQTSQKRATESARKATVSESGQEQQATV